MAAEPLPSLPASCTALEAEQLLDAISDAYFLIDVEGVIRRANPFAQLMLDRNDLIGCHIDDFLGVGARWRSLKVGQSFPVPLLRYHNKQVRLTFACEAEAGGYHCLVALDDKELRFREQLLRQSSMVQMTLCSITDAVISIDAHGLIETMNPMARELLHLSDQRGIGLPVEQIFIVADPVSHQLIDSPVAQVLSRGNTGKPTWEALLYASERKPTLISVQVVPMRNTLSKIDGCLLVFRDTTQAGRENHRLNWQARHDALTALPNRQAFENEISQAVERAQNQQMIFGLLYIDVYQFKVINDSCGHVGGDEILRSLSDLMASQLRSRDLLARLGSDEFGVLLRNCTLAGAQRVADILLSAVQGHQFLWDSREVKVGVSIGVVTIDRDCESEGQVLATANAACCAAKELGRNRLHLYNKDREVEQRRSEINWVIKINEALADERLCLYQQKIMPINQAETSHYEVLIRLRDVTGELVDPGLFIPAAERFGLIDDIDRWVVAKVVAHIQQRTAAELPLRVYSVNLSGFTLGDPMFGDYVLKLIDDAQIDARLLNFEVTETAAIRHLESAIGFMRKLRARGSRFYLDDFGSGLSSFTYLKELPVDYLKIDGSFVRTMLEDPASFAMVSTINHLAHTMGLRTVAEYVESDALLNKLTEVGVDYVQGFGVDEPSPLV